jgi:hypothetical protein
MALFRRVPILGALCGEVLICQCLSSLLSFMFMMCYKETLQADEERASYIGKVRFLEARTEGEHSQSPHTHRSCYFFSLSSATRRSIL